MRHGNVCQLFMTKSKDLAGWVCELGPDSGKYQITYEVFPLATAGVLPASEPGEEAQFLGMLNEAELRDGEFGSANSKAIFI